MKLFEIKKIALVGFFVFAATLSWHGVSFAASTSTWTCTSTANEFWNVSSSWSLAAVPTSSTNVLFSGSSTLPITMRGVVNVNAFSVTTAYTSSTAGAATITQGTSTITIGTSGLTQASGTFAGGSGTITVKGPFNLTGGSFTDTTSTLTLIGTSDTITPSAFKNNSSTVIINATTTLITGSSTFYNLTFIAPGSTYPDSTSTIATGTVLTVQNNLGMAGDVINNPGGNAEAPVFMGGTIDAQGNILNSVQNTNYYPGNTAIVVDGTGTQTIGAAAVSDTGTLTLPSSFTINKVSGGVTFAQTVDYPATGSWTNLSNTTITPGTSTVEFFQGGGTATVVGSSTFYALTVSGSSTFYNLHLMANPSDEWPISLNSMNLTIASSSALIVQNKLLINNDGDSVNLLGNGTIYVNGNLEGGSGEESDASGTASIVLNGTSTQIVNGNDDGYGTDLEIPNLTISKPSGAVTFENLTEIVGGNFTNASGTVINAGTSTVAFIGVGTSTYESPTITGSSTFYNLDLIDSASIGGLGYAYSMNPTIPSSTVLTVQNNLTYGMSGGYLQLLGGGTIDVAGNIDGVRGAIAPGTQNGTIIMNGTSTQVIDQFINQPYVTSLYLPNLIINKTSGLVGVSGDYDPIVQGNLTITNGELQISAGIASSSNPQYFEVDGTLTVSSGTRLSDYPSNGASTTLAFGSSVVNNGMIFLDGTSLQCGSSLTNDIILQPANGFTSTTWSGSGNYLIRYVSVNSQKGPVTALNSTNLGSSNWTFTSGPYVQLVQTASSSGGTGTSNLTIPFGFYPRTGDLILVAVSANGQSISTPTDTASNTYYLVATSTFGSSPTRSISLYYAKNVTSTNPFSITARGTGGGGSQMLSAATFEYTGITPSTTLDAYSYNTDTTGSAVSLTSGTATATSTNDLFFGAATFATSTTLTSGTGWTPVTNITNNTTNQALYTEDVLSAVSPSTAATWTANASTSYAAILATFRIPLPSGYITSGTLDSQTFDTGAVAGANLNSLTWQSQGTQPSGTTVQFQIAPSNSATGPWNFVGPDGTSGTYFSGSAGSPIPLVSTTNGYGLFNGYRYFRYRVTLSTTNPFATPIVTQVVVNWSP
jgi:hypothetical protein